MGYNKTDYEALSDVKVQANVSFDEMEDNLNSINGIVNDIQAEWEGSSNTTYTDAMTNLKNKFKNDRDKFNAWIDNTLAMWSQEMKQNEAEQIKNVDENIN